jgi:hypothetical protein
VSGVWIPALPRLEQVGDAVVSSARLVNAFDGSLGQPLVGQGLFSGGVEAGEPLNSAWPVTVSQSITPSE